nr:ATP-binding protein [Kineosporia mesophila]
MIGRRDELAAVARLIDGVARGSGGRLFLVGPPGAGKSALLDAAAEMAQDRGVRVYREDIGDEPGLVLIDHGDQADPPLLPEPGAATGVLVASRYSVKAGPELPIGGLGADDLARLVPALTAEAVHAIWLASGGIPGIALGFADELGSLDEFADALVHLALTAPSRSGFLELDFGLIRLLESATERPLSATERARILARLAREQLSDPSSGARRRELIDEALDLARVSGNPATIAEVLDSRLHALWDPIAVHERLSSGSEIVDQARRAGDDLLELRGLFWRFTALAELGDLDSAEAALTAYGRAAELAGNAEAAVVVVSRRAMLAVVRGRFDEAATLTAEVAVRGRQVGLSDTDSLVGTLRYSVFALRGDGADVVEPLREQARRRPGHFFEASAAWALAEAGRDVEAGLELDRLLPAVLNGSGPRWLGAVADLAHVASRVGDPDQAETLYQVLLPYRGRLVVWGGANTITGTVDEQLGGLAARLGRTSAAVDHLTSAIELQQRIGALPWLAHTLPVRARVLSARGRDGDAAAARADLERARSTAQRLGLTRVLKHLKPTGDEWRLMRDGDTWLLEAGGESARLRDGRGLHYLRALLSAPGQEIAALDLVAGGSGIRVPDGDPVLDETARQAFQRHLQSIDKQLESADRAGDAVRATALHDERAAVVNELRRATGVGGGSRRVTTETERARVNVTRTLWATVERVEALAPRAGAHLRASLRTGRYLRYAAAPGGPTRWNT